MARHLSQISILPAFALLGPLAGTADAAVSATGDIAAYLQVMGGLLIVLAIILVLYALFKNRFSIINPRSSKAIRILEIQPLMPRKAVCLIEVRGREYLLGVANESITLLADLGKDGNTSFKDILDESRAGQHS